MLPERHIMLDIETLGTSTNAPVISIGAVAFYPHDLSIGQAKQWNINDIEHQIKLGRAFDFATIKWWLNQSKEAIDKTFNSKNAITTKEALNGLSQFCLTDDGGNVWGANNVYIWGNGNMFDNVIMRSLYKDFNLDYPTSFRNDLDFRTIKWLFKDKQFPQINDVGTGHNAVDDAMWQVKKINQFLELV
jgi:exodeoxyribonuclease VIII